MTRRRSGDPKRVWTALSRAVIAGVSIDAAVHPAAPPVPRDGGRLPSAVDTKTGVRFPNGIRTRVSVTITFSPSPFDTYTAAARQQGDTTKTRSPMFLQTWPALVQIAGWI